LCQDIPIPTFFQEKKEEDWTDEERRAAVEYQKKVKELEEEREKFRKVTVVKHSLDDVVFTVIKQIHWQKMHLSEDGQFVITVTSLHACYFV